MRSLPRLLRIGLLAAAAALAAPAVSRAEEGIPGQVLLSDGASFEGPVFTRGEMPIRLYALDSRQFRKIHLAEVLRISVRVAKAELVKEFEWVEMGSDEKIFTGKAFPRKDFEGEVELRSGETVSGHLLGVVCLREGDEIRKFELLRYQRGEPGQSLESLVHVKEIVFPEASRAVACRLAARLQGAAPGTTVHALGTAAPVLREAKPAGPSEWKIENLAPGTYDLIVLSGGMIALGLSAPAQARGGDPLTPEAQKEIRARVAEIDNFFTVREAVRISGTSAAVRALVRMTREEPSTYDSQEKCRFYRFEIWTMVRVGERWMVESRTFVTRGKDPRGGASSEPRVLPCPALEGLAPTAERPEARAEADLGDGGDRVPEGEKGRRGEGEKK